MRPVILSAILALTAFADSAGLPADDRHVDGASVACSDAGPGTLDQPYCSITAGVLAHAGPGTTLIVHPALYREQVTVSASGASGSPFVLQAAGDAVVDGTDDFSAPGLWSLHAGQVWLAAGVTWTPHQVFLDGARLSSSSEPPEALPPDSFRQVPGEGLYVNAGGDNPGLHLLWVGRRVNGFRLNGRSWVEVRGFNVRHADDDGISLLAASDHTVVAGNTILLSGGNAISVNACTDVRVEGNESAESNTHGIYLYNGTADSLVGGNDSHHNARSGGTGVAGIKLEGAARITLRANRTHENQDTGLQVNSSTDILSVNNVSWGNGDHGYDQLGGANALHAGEVAWGNRNDGFSFEGGCSGITLVNSIAADNGLTTGRFDLLVDATCLTGFVSDHNILHKPTTQPIVKYAGLSYTTIAAYSAVSGQDLDSLQADPLFLDPPAADFHLMAGSPAIDSAGPGPAAWATADAAGNPRVDDPDTPNTGSGAVAYADRGAFEFLGNCNGGAGPSAEQCDGVDNDCNGSPDDLPAPASFITNMELTHLAGVTTLSWPVVPGVTGYDVVVGSLAIMVSSHGDLASSTTACLSNDTSIPGAQHDATPSAGTGFYFLARPVNCGARGTYDTGASSQSGSRDAAIASSGNDCP